MNKKTIWAIVIFVFLAIGAPFGLSLFFTDHTNGKFVVEQHIDAPYLQNNGNNLQLVFYGYVGCTKVCAPMLQNLSSFYESAPFSDLKPFVGVSFVNLKPDTEPDQPDMFAKTFNPKFQGIYLSQKQLMTIDREFGMFFSKRLVAPDEIDHSDYLYLVERQKDGSMELVNIYTTHPLNKEQVIKDIHDRLRGV